MKTHHNPSFCRIGRFVACILMLLSTRAALAQTMQWKLLTGSLDSQQTSHYGTQGIPSPDNRVGARFDAASWTGADGKLYLFGGEDMRGYHNDLWRFDLASGNWTWLKGSSVTDLPGVFGTQGRAAAANTPGARQGAVTWAGADGKLYLFGGFGYDSVGQRHGNYNDLWRFDPVSGNWTWLKGSQFMNASYPTYGTQGRADPANTPACSVGAAAWTGADGKFYLYGGSALWSTSYNDLWRFDPASGNWTWLKGSKEPSQPAVYGIQGLANAANTPGCRMGAAAWTGADGKFYLFGGQNIEYDCLNDLWRYDPISGNWTWLKGSQAVEQPGVYGTQGVAAAANTPGARNSAAAWTGADGKFYLFGGSGSYNDLWRFDPASGNWTWIKGSQAVDQPGVYSTRDVDAVANTPGARCGMATWTVPDGKVYLFGGSGYDCSRSYDALGDLWCLEKGRASAQSWQAYR